MSIDIAELRVLLNAADGRSDSPRMGHFGVRMAKVLPELLDELERLRTENEAWLTAASEAEFTGGTNRETRETMVAVGKGALEEMKRLRRFEAAELEYEEAADETGPTKHNPWLCDVPRRDCAACSRYDAACAAKDLAIAEARAAQAKEGDRG